MAATLEMTFRKNVFSLPNLFNNSANAISSPEGVLMCDLNECSIISGSKIGCENKGRMRSI